MASARRAAARIARAPIAAIALAAVYPVMFLWAHNVDDDVSIGEVLLSLGGALTASFLVYATVRVLVRDRTRAGWITLVVQAVAFSFGHVVGATTIPPGSGRETLFLIAVLAGTVVGAIWIARRPRSDVLFRIAVPALAALTAFNVVLIVQGGEVAPPRDLETAAVDLAPELDPETTNQDRDVYYLIFDRYGGERTLRDLYGYDLEPFLQGLRDRGFEVVDDALANYPQTTHSLASSLNMVHLDALAAAIGEGADDWDPLYASLQDTTSSRLFQEMGYRYVHVGSWWGPTAIDAAADENHAYDVVREFPETFARTTIVPTILERLPFGPDDIFERQYQRVEFQFASIEAVAADPASTYTFAHFTLPHPPYVFRADGTYRSPGDVAPLEQQYLDQLTYTNTRIDRLLDQLLAGPDASDPIIVLQSDEGPYPPELDTGIDVSFTWGTASDVELRRRFQILNAMFLPGPSSPDVPPGITPVNTFRLIFDRYFGAEFPLLPDRSLIFIDRDHPYRFEDVTDRLRG